MAIKNRTAVAAESQETAVQNGKADLPQELKNAMIFENCAQDVDGLKDFTAEELEELAKTDEGLLSLAPNLSKGREKKFLESVKAILADAQGE